MQSEKSATPPLHAVFTIHADTSGPVVDRNIYGHFAEHLGRCIYEGVWVGEDSAIPNTRGIRNDVVEALKHLNIPVLRWPGGCFADEYHWMDGIGPREKRPRMINTHWGHVVENNHFGTHEFLDFCEQIGAAPYICGNVGSGTVREMSQWAEYLTAESGCPMADLREKHGREKPWQIPFFGVGNESWGCGGNMRPEYYADLFRRYNTFIRNHGDQNIQRIACGPNTDDYAWTEALMSIAGPHMDALSLHYYTVPTGVFGEGKMGSATEFDETSWHTTLRRALYMDELIARHAAIMDRHDPEKRVGLAVDEWGSWYDSEPGTNRRFLHQQNTMRDALIAALSLHIFQRHADRVRMANIAQLVNVLQAVILTDGSRMLLTPTYHVFEMLKPHQDAASLVLESSPPPYIINGELIPATSGAATRSSTDGRIHLSIANTNPSRTTATTIHLDAKTVPKQATGRLLHAAQMNAHNTFDTPNAVRPADLSGIESDKQKITFTLPAMSVAVLEIKI